MIVFAHRGASGYAPENTLAAFDLALELGTNAIESDVLFTADGKLIFHHDATIKLFGYVPFPVLLLPFSYFNNRGANFMERNLRVSDIFHTYFQRDLINEILWSLDVPNTRSFKKLAKVVKSYGIGQNIYACNTTGRGFKKWRKIAPAINLVWSIRGHHIQSLTNNEIIGRCKFLDVDVLNIKVTEANQSLVKKAKASGLKVFIWDVHDKERYNIALNFTPDAIYSNFPDKALNGFKSPVIKHKRFQKQHN